MTRTCITTVTAIRSEEWIKAVISGGAALFSVDGSAKERVNAALNDMPIAKANSGRKNNTSRTSASSSSKSGYSESFCQGGAWIFFILLTQILSLLLPE